ncbi:hypothetical protein IG631_00440 [Alternaria alternata]|nr:hypothetical protein IG631_00440 [Alternaria alternata]
MRVSESPATWTPHGAPAAAVRPLTLRSRLLQRHKITPLELCPRVFSLRNDRRQRGGPEFVRQSIGFFTEPRRRQRGSNTDAALRGQHDSRGHANHLQAILITTNQSCCHNEVRG